MSAPVVVIGAGMGGLSAALCLARRGVDVTVLEARATPGGLAEGFTRDGLRFDGGPYILLDVPGLRWAFAALGLDVDTELVLRTVQDVYEVRSPQAPAVRFRADLDATALDFDRTWPGSGKKYVAFVGEMARLRVMLEPLLRISRPSARDIIATRALPAVPFLLRSLRGVLAGAGLPAPVMKALSIWTYVAGQTPDEAPSPLAFVPALIHTVGAALPRGGVGAVPAAVFAAAQRAGVTFRFGAAAQHIDVVRGRAAGVVLLGGERVAARAVVSNHSGVGTYLELLESRAVHAVERERLARLPLQSPGVSAYLAVKGKPGPTYLRFALGDGVDACRLLVQPAAVWDDVTVDGRSPARLLSPMGHGKAEETGEAGQRAHLERLLKEPWWRDHVGDVDIVETRLPRQWGASHHLHRDSMNPVMTAQFMREGRLAHRSPHVKGLYLAGSSTHPGQWVSFCMISGVLAARALLGDDDGEGVTLLATSLVAVGGHRVRVARQGDPSHPAVVLLHGYPDTLQIWCALLPLLAARRHVVAFDWPGLGDSAPWPGAVAPSALADRLAALLDAWGMERAHVVGADMGAQPALCFAARHPARVRSVVAMNALLAHDGATSWEVALLRRLGLYRLALPLLPGAVFRRCVQTFVPAGTPLPAALRQDMWSAFARPAVRDVVVRMCAAYERELPALPALYRQIACPVLALWGGREAHFPLAHARRLASCAARARVDVLPGGAHWMAWHAAGEVAARLLGFFDEADRPSCG